MSKNLTLLAQATLVGYLLLVGGTFGLGGLTVHAQDSVIRVDVGVDTIRTLLPGWNNLAGAINTEPVVTLPLVNTLNQATGITLRTVWTVAANADDTGVYPIGHNYDGPYPSPTLDGIPASALTDGVYVRDGEKMTITLEGLDAFATYDFIFYGASDVSGDYALFTLTGGNTGRTHIYPTLNNADSVGYITGLKADALNTMVILFEGRRAGGNEQSPTQDNDAIGRFNYMQITEHLLAVPGDYNGDRGVDASDYSVWKSSYGSHDSLAADGNKNGIVDAADYTIWRNHIGPAGGAAGDAGLSNVPEPGTVSLAILGMTLAIARSTTRRRSILR
jgi:hypothetical protein